MFGYMFKNLPAKYIFAGYGVRKSLTILTTEENGKIIYDVFLYTYVDNYLSFFLQMENGKYKSVDFNVEVPETSAEELVSRHLSRGLMKNMDDYEEYDRETLVGVFGLRNIEVLMKQTDEMKKQNSEGFDVSLEAILDIKAQYMGMEVMGVINNFNKCLKYDKGRITIPPITYGPDDPYKSLIGDEMDYFDFMSNKDSDKIIQDLKKLADSLDGIGNIKSGREITITKSSESEAASVSVKRIDEKK
ncbi:MAG TPA: hypothetical protein IAC02_08025 [Candidatus Coprovivens excrementavium]|nr:hypothetical protein [Candidatus Coprovivens excrementavium]